MASPKHASQTIAAARPTGLRIAFLGASALNDKELIFCQSIGKALSTHLHVTVATSGFTGRTQLGEQSFTFAIAHAFAEALKPDEVARRVATFVVQRADGSLSPGTACLGQAIGTRGRNTKNRQGQIVARSDILCIGGGKSGTREFADLALWIDKPVLPLPFISGASRDFWFANKEYLQIAFELSEDKWSRWSNLQLKGLNSSSIERLADETIMTLLSSALGNCIVCMPFAARYLPLYEQILKPAIASAHLHPIRMDQAPTVGDITESLRAEIGSARCVIAIIDESNPNVLYEVGFAHALNKPVVLMKAMEGTRKRDPKLPFDIRTHRVVSYDSGFDATGIQRTRSELQSLLRNLSDAILRQTY